MQSFFSTKNNRQALQVLSLCILSASLNSPSAWAEGVNVNTGIVNESILGDHNQQANNAGVAVNGNVNDSNLNNNQNSNTNVLQPIVVSQPNYTSAGGGGQGGNSALILPRNPLPLSNASLGRSNFGMQVGVQNNPGISTITGGRESGLGWFMQAGLNIPFGKIPSVLSNNQNSGFDTMRQDRQDAQRRVFGSLDPNAQRAHAANVQGRVVGLNAYNYSTVQSGKLDGSPSTAGVGEIVLPQPKVLALKSSNAFNQPLDTGLQVGLIEIGHEYPYLGHTRSGWVKVLLPNGKEAWTSTRFEYIKFDYTEIDNLAVAPSSEKNKAVMNPSKEEVKENLNAIRRKS